MDKRLCVVWSSADPDVATRLVYMYTTNSLKRDWWDEVRIIVWGPSARALAENGNLQAGLRDCAAAGVELMACKACADSYGVSGTLSAMGVEVLYTGEVLTNMLQSGWTVLTF